MLLRTNLDLFWSAYSSDNGLSWRVLHPSDLDASSAPGYLIRLASGRLALVWNRLYPQGQTSCPRRGGQLCEAQASWHRAELSFALSEDDGQSWGAPVVIARESGGSLSYPYLYERRPGLLWVFTHFGSKPPLRISLREGGFVGKIRS
jgi:hypothetical protein